MKNPRRICLSFGLIFVLTSCTNMLFYPMPGHVRTPEALGIDYEDISVESKDGTKLHGWWLHTDQKPKATILFFHGNAENISTHIGHVYWLVDFGYDVVLVDYRGYGHSQGKPDLPGSINDIQASLSYVYERLSHEENPLVVIGQSLGASMSIAAVASSHHKADLKGFVVASAFSDYRTIAQQALSRHWLTWIFQWPLSFVVNNQYSPESYVADIAPVPLLIVHGQHDNIIDASHADTLYEMAGEPRYLEKIDARHNDVFDAKINRDLLLNYLDRFVSGGGAE